MELNERKMTILKAVIKTYLETGEPVGSRTISKCSDLNLSSATIRNEMADLEELGYIMQPHTSAGRIPSDKGYRFYVDLLMEEKNREVEEIKEQMLTKADKMDQILKQAAKVLANSTNYATMVTAPTYNRNKLKFIQLSKVDEKQIVVVVVMDGNIIKNEIITVKEELNNETLLKLNMLLNTNLNGVSIEEISLGMIAKLKELSGEYSGVISEVFDIVGNVIRVDDDMEIYTSGASNVFKYPELRDNQTAEELLNVFEDKQQLAEFVTQSISSGEEGHGLQVYIGNESSVESMRDCSVVTTTYDLGDGMQGCIGIVGPKRMNYEHVMKTLKTLKDELDHIYHKKE